MMASALRFRPPLRLALAAGIAVWVLTGTTALAQAPCSSSGNTVFPCSLGGTVIFSAPTGTIFDDSGVIVGSGAMYSFIQDPQNPGFALTSSIPGQAAGPLLPVRNGTLNFATVSGLPTINGLRVSITCGVTGAASFGLTITMLGFFDELNCPPVAAPGTTMTVTSQTSLSPTTSLALMMNMSGTASSGSDTVTFGGFSVQVPDQNFIGSMAQLAAEENWTTAFTLVNKGNIPAQALLSFLGDATDPNGNRQLTLPLIFPQHPPSAGPLLTASLDRALNANALLIVDTAGQQTPPVLVGSAQLSATGAVDGFAIFRQIVTKQEAVVPLETRNASSYLLAFDNTNGQVLGVAVANVSAQTANIPVIIRDDTGARIADALERTLSLAPNGHTAFVLSDPTLGFSVTANKRGTIEFDTPAGGQISVLGLRFTPPNNSLTTIPALANVGTNGGSIAHLASGGDGWETTFVLVNTGTSAAQFALSFFADMTGAPLYLPLSFPQAGGGPSTTASSVTQMLGAGATLLIVSSGAPLAGL
jgi:hypothetical protein